MHYKVERERDKDRLESKRRIDQLTKNIEVDQQENRKKTSEVRSNYNTTHTQHFVFFLILKVTKGLALGFLIFWCFIWHCIKYIFH